MLKTYDPGQYDVIFAGRLLEGFGEDTFISVAVEAPGFSDRVGVDGEVTRAKSYDSRATVSVTLMQTSLSNNVLSSIYLADRAAPNGAGVGSLRIVDRSGTSVFEASRAWIQREPDAELGREASERTWELRCADYRGLHGGNPDTIPGV